MATVQVPNEGTALIRRITEQFEGEFTALRELLRAEMLREYLDRLHELQTAFALQFRGAIEEYESALTRANAMQLPAGTKDSWREHALVSLETFRAAQSLLLTTFRQECEQALD